jgi:dihydrofolate synthase/folylpolyglutamate synthase
MLSQSTKLYKILQKRYSRRINLDLKRIKKVLKKLDQPHLEIKNPINIIGSDGKMSTLTSLKYLLEANKKKVNTFTSPHLYDFRQRFWLKDRFITVKEINRFIKKIEKTKVKLTLFELLTCIYILSAKEIKNINYNLVETGLLFKKDSTNLWQKPRAQIITNINFQHQDWVQPKTLFEICRQKLSSLSKKTTIYIGKQKPKTLKIIKYLLRKNKSKIIFPSSWKIKKINNRYIYKDKKNEIVIRSKYINSEGLIDNLGLAIKVALDFGIDKKRIIRTIPKIKFEGRVQYIKKGKLKALLSNRENLLVDGCHSMESGKNLNNYLRIIKEPIYGIFGMQKNKLPDEFISCFKNTFKKIVTIKIPDEPNSLSAYELKNITRNYVETLTANNIENALKLLSTKEKKTIVIFGSLYLVGSFLSKN